ncbi:polysaccharide biosynthesis/export family protein [Akkermansiaceae bacterium]|nr:polysaccharide biosynthesis/export family protein [Akkermansiaceae bacterium]
MKLFLFSILSLFLVNVATAQISVNQTLTINVQGVPVAEQSRLNSSYQVSREGTIRMWVIGSVRAAGRTPDQLAQSIAAAYRSAGIYTNPNFTVLVPTDTQLAAKTYTVGGQVKVAGPKPWANDLTLYGAIQAAGGETPFGAITRVKLYRGGRVFNYNLKEDRAKSIRVLPGDMIEVPQKGWTGQ